MAQSFLCGPGEGKFIVPPPPRKKAIPQASLHDRRGKMKERDISRLILPSLPPIPTNVFGEWIFGTTHTLLSPTNSEGECVLPPPQKKNGPTFGARRGSPRGGQTKKKKGGWGG